MTQGLKRYQFTGDLHFVTFSCYRRLPYLASAAARTRFEGALERSRSRCGFCVLGYVVMPEHVHLLVSEPDSVPLAKALHSLKLSMSKLSLQRPFWQARYYDFNVYSHRKQVEKLRYIHRNPVHRGLVEQPQDWRWSSFRHYATGERGVVEIESFWTAAQREKEAGKSYKKQ
jgi:putative transposase